MPFPNDSGGRQQDPDAPAHGELANIIDVFRTKADRPLLRIESRVARYGEEAMGEAD
jgi:hypothetical protein